MSITWILLLSIPFVLYLAFSLLLRSGLNRKYPIKQNSNYSVSVIVVARNEAKTILDCLQSLAKLDYPSNFLDITVVNDRSDDGTDQIITEFIKGKSQFKYVTITKPISTLSGKASAIAQAIEHCQGKIIFVTDADCIVPQNWIEKSVQYFSDEVGLIAGFTLLKFSHRFFNDIQNLDWAYLLSVAAGAAGLGIPLTCMGNNFAFRRVAYQQVGGYQGVGFSVTEDFALLKAIAQQTHWKIVFPVDHDCLVKTRPMKNWRDFFSQRKRWAIGGQSVHWFGKLLIGISVLTDLILIVWVIFSQHYILVLSLLSCLIISDYLLLRSLMKQLHTKLHLKFLPCYKIFFMLYSTILLINVLLNRKVNWKGIQY